MDYRGAAIQYTGILVYTGPDPQARGGDRPKALQRDVAGPRILPMDRRAAVATPNSLGIVTTSRSRSLEFIIGTWIGWINYEAVD